MESIDKYLQYLNERRSSVSDNAIMYHGSKIQGLKFIDPSKWVDAVKEEHMETIWASWDKSFASMFCIDWRKNIKDIAITTNWGWVTTLPDREPESCYSVEQLNKEYGKYEYCKKIKDNKHWLVAVPTRYKYLLKAPCSLYMIKGEDWVIPKKEHNLYDFEWPEAYSKKPAKVIKEIKYNSVEEAYKKNGVEIVVKNHIMNSTILQRIFSKLKI